MEIEPLRNVGVALSENTLQELANSKGLEVNVRDLTEAQKAQLRYIQILKSSTEWQTDMGRTLVTPASALRILRQEFTMLGRAIGRIFIPIIMSAMPYVIALSQLLTDLANRLASFLGYEITDIDYSGLTSGLGDLSSGISDIGDAADKTKKQLNTMLAPFDELNVVQEKVKKSGSGLDGLSGDDLGLDLPEYDALANLTDEMSERVEKAKENLKSIVPIVLSIGAGFATWKISKSLLSGIEYISKIKGKNISFSFSILGVANFLADFKRFKDYLDDILENGTTFTNVTGLLSEFAGGMGDVFITLGHLKLGGSLKVVQGIGEIVSAISDISKEKVNWKNITTIITGLTNVTIGIGAITKNWKAVGFATALQGLTSAIDELRENWKAIKKGDWSGVDKAKLAINALQIVGGLVIAFEGFNKIKKTADMGSAVKNMEDVTKATKGLESPISTLTLTLKSIIKNLGLGIVILGEVAVAAGLFAGAIWVLGKELDEIGKAWKPVLDNGDTILSALGLGTLLLIGVGSAAYLLGTITTSAGASIPISIGIGTLVLAEIGVSAGLFVGEITALGKSLDELGKAWQPVLDNGDTVLTDIELGTALLVAIGGLAALLGAATTATGLALPVAIGLGTALLVEMGIATKEFVKSTTDIVKQINNDLTPQLDLMNSNSSTVKKGLTNYTKFLTDFAGIIVKTTGVNVLSGIGGAINTMIGWFSGDPIKKLAKDVKKTYDQTTDLNNKLVLANPELQEAIDLLSDYLTLIKKLDNLTKNNKTSKLSGNIFVNMKDAGKNIVTGLVSGMESQIKNYNNIMDSIYSAMNYNKAWNAGYTFGSGMANGINNGIKNSLKTTIKLLDTNTWKTEKQFKIQAYANGGYPTSGDLFFANENGVPEMVGRIGNQTAVANNDQITTSMTNALLQALGQYDFGNKQPSRIVVNLGNKTLYDGYGEYINSETDRYGTTTLNI